MAHSRSLLLHGLSLLVRRFAAVLWIFVLGLVLALLFSLRPHAQFSSLLDHSFAAQSITRGFDLPTAASAFMRLSHDTPAAGTASFGSIPVFLLLYFILVPGTLFCYLADERARLSTLLRQGLLHFWRFVRITVVALLVFGLILGPLSALNTHFSTFVDNRMVGRPAFLLETFATFLLFLVATLLRLFFDMVEVYTVQLGLIPQPDGRFDRRVRRTFAPAWRALRLHLTRLWGSFLLLSLLGFAGFLLLARTGLHTLAKPHVGLLLFFSQLAVLLSIATRFWQRGAEVTFAQDHPLRAVDETRYTTPAAIPYPAAVPAVTPFVPVPAPEPLTRSESMPTHPGTPAGSASSNQLTPPGDLPLEQLPPPEREHRIDPGHLPPTVPPATSHEHAAPIQGAYNIDPFTPLPPAPNPISTEEEDALRDAPRRPTLGTDTDPDR